MFLLREKHLKNLFFTAKYLITGKKVVKTLDFVMNYEIMSDSLKTENVFFK